MANNKFTMPLAGANAGLDIVPLVAKSDWHDYKDGKRTSDAPMGVKFDVALQGNRLSPLTIKIKGSDPIPQLTDEEISKACAEMKYIYARFSECEVSIYTINGEMKMSSTATGVQLVTEPGKAALKINQQ